MSSVSTGDTAVVILKFQTNADLPFNYPVTGSIGIRAQNGNSFSIPFVFEKVAESTGAVKITVTNQFTYYVQDAPKVAGAHVQIKNYFTGAVYADGYTDSSGTFASAGIPEGQHRIVVEKEKHLPYNNVITIDPGDTAASTVFLNYQAITFSWSVIPTAIEDQYEITLTTKFETNIPVPVVTIEMPKTMPQLSGTEIYAFDATLTNHGLITAKDVALNLPTNDTEYEFVTNYVPSDLLAQQSIQVPVIMRRRGASNPGPNFTSPSIESISKFLGIESSQYNKLQAQSLNCQDFAGVVYWYKCSISTGLWQRGGVLFTYSGRVCTGGGGNSGGGSTGGGSGGSGGIGTIVYPVCAQCPSQNGGGESTPVPVVTAKTSCVECIVQLIKTIANCSGTPQGKFISSLIGDSKVVLCIIDGYNNNDRKAVLKCAVKYAAKKKYWIK